MPAIATYPGTVTPLRGLAPFAESERDVLFGRDRERDELYKLLTGEGFRAGLLYGESGAGKTSLLRAALLPHLRDHGVIALYTDDSSDPVGGFASAVVSATGLQPAGGEQPLAFLARVVAQALPGQLYLFILDGIESALSATDDRVIQDLGDLFARVVTRSGGRARFLFSCASDSIHQFNRLEKRTGSLFPPQSRYLLDRFDVATAAMVLDRTLTLAGVATQPELGQAIAELLGRTDPILPADLQLAALAVRDLALTGVGDVQRVQSAHDLEQQWIAAVARAAGSEKVGLRLAAELAAPHAGALAPTMVAARAGVDAATAQRMLDVMAGKGLLRTVSVTNAGETCYVLAHPILASRVREVAAPARASAKRAYELLGSKANEGKRLGLKEWRELRREGITPATAMEQGVINRTKRFWLIIAAAAAALPIVILIIIWISIAGNYYLDVDRRKGGPERVVVRAGSPGLSAFHWLPGSPSYGSVVADTGYTRSMIDDASWGKIKGQDITGDLDGDYAAAADDALRPELRLLIDYATTGSAPSLGALRKAADTPEKTAALLTALRPVATGSADEVGFVKQQLDSGQPAGKAAAMALALEATRQGSEAYEPLLAAQLAAGDEETRRLAFAAVQGLGPERSGKLFQRALAEAGEGEARRELLGVMATVATTAAPSADTARSVLASKEMSAAVRAEARERLRRAFAVEPEAAAVAAAGLAGDSDASNEERVFALELLLDEAEPSSYPAISEAIDSARRAAADPVRAAALPLYARMDPKQGAAELVQLLEDKKLSTEMRVAMTLAWGEVAKTKDKAAQGALEQLIKDPNIAVRAAAARAYGHVGRLAQTPLEKMIKNDDFSVSVGAAVGMAYSADAGGNANNAAGGIFQLWKQKGRARREAAKVYAQMARRHPKAVFGYLQSAVSIKDDPGLHPIGAHGMCAAMAGGYKAAQGAIENLANNDAVEVRRIAVNCVSDNTSKFTKTAATVANDLKKDPSVDIRIEAARVLARLAADDKGTPPGVPAALTFLIADTSRDVRVIALGALEAMGNNAPKEAAAALVKAFDRADAGEKQALLGAARAIGAGELVQPAIVDPAPSVRAAALELAIATGNGVGAALSAALTDKDPSVRREALRRLADSKGALDQAAIDKALALASRDTDAGIADQALATFARLGAPDRVKTALQAALASPSEAERARAAAACIGLVDRKTAPEAVALLEPLLDDPSHDVRVALLRPLAAAYAAHNDAELLGKMLRNAEGHAMKRLVAAAAFIVQVRSSASPEPAEQKARSVLDGVASGGSPMVRRTAALTSGLIKNRTDGLGFLATLVP